MKKIMAILLSFTVVFALAACGSSSGSSSAPASDGSSAAPAGSSAAEPAVIQSDDTIYYEQVVTLDFFGQDVDITFVEDSEETEFFFTYSFAGNDIEAFGEIQNGVYVITQDETGFATEAAGDIFGALTDQWTDPDGNPVTMAPAKAE